MDRGREPMTAFVIQVGGRGGLAPTRAGRFKQ